MIAERSQRLESLFAAVAELKPEARAVWLDAECGADKALRLELEALLAADEGAGRFIEQPALAALAKAQANEPDEAPTDSEMERRIGPYRTIRQIGVGGMGVIYLAARADDQFKQCVAVKVIRRGMDHEAIIRRFRHERQILAGLNHPNIARLLDGGATDDGLPWFALEYIEGQPLTAYCAERRLTLSGRLQLFLTICAAVQYAHQNLVVHRDLKPSNILITDDGQPKLLDFGIAKLLHSESAAETLDLTVTGMKPMTPAYASPEQARGETITTASDIYSLGMLLYELLTQRRPYHVTSRMTESEIARVICEQEPVKPSLVVLRREEAEQSQSKIEPAKLARQLRGDLDNIVLTALRKEPNRRYASVEQFAEDVRRHLDGLPVTASKDTVAYRGTKFVRRNKVLVAATAVVVLSLLTGIILAAWQAHVARVREQEAKQQATIAQKERDKARAINDFFRNVLLIAGPVYERPGHIKDREVTLVDAIRYAEPRIDTEFKDQPETRIDLHHTFGRIWQTRGDHHSAEPHVRAVMQLSRQFLGERHQRFINSLYHLGCIEGQKADAAAAITDYAEAITLIRQAVARMRLNEPQNVSIPHMLRDLGQRLGWTGHYPEAESLILEAQEAFRKLSGTKDEYNVAYTFCLLGNLYRDKGELERAQAAYHENLELLRRLPVEYEASEALYGLGVIDYTSGNYQAVETRLNEAEKLFSQYLGESNNEIADYLYYLTTIHCLQRNYARAEVEARRALNIRRQQAGPDHPWTITALGLLGKVLLSAGRPGRAAPYLREAVEQYRAAPNRSSWVWSGASGILGECLTLLKRYDEAGQFLNESYTGLKSVRGEKSPEMVETRQRLVKLYEAWGKPEQAAQFRDEASTITK